MTFICVLGRVEVVQTVLGRTWCEASFPVLSGCVFGVFQLKQPRRSERSLCGRHSLKCFETQLFNPQRLSYGVHFTTYHHCFLERGTLRYRMLNSLAQHSIRFGPRSNTRPFYLSLLNFCVWEEGGARDREGW